jgi:hypothetical protein
VLHLDAAVHYHREPRALGQLGRLYRIDPELKPESRRAGRDCLLRNCQGLAPGTKDLDQIDRERNAGQIGPGALAQDTGGADPR